MEHSNYSRMHAFDVANPHKSTFAKHHGRLISVEFYRNLRPITTVSGLRGQQIVCKLTLHTGSEVIGRALYAEDGKHEQDDYTGCKLAFERALEQTNTVKKTRKALWDAFFKQMGYLKGGGDIPF